MSNQEPVPQKKSFSTVLKKEAVEIDGKEYTIREIMGVQRNQYLNQVRKKVDITYGEDGKPVVNQKDFTGEGIDILSLCLYDQNGTMVLPNVIEKWPASVIQELAKIAVTLSGLNKEGEEAAKKN